MPEDDGYAAYYLARWRALSEAERKAMHNLRTVAFMNEAWVEFYGDSAERNA